MAPRERDLCPVACWLEQTFEMRSLNWAETKTWHYRNVRTLLNNSPKRNALRLGKLQ
jgi:hypothetical protein